MHEMKNSGIEWIGEIPVGWKILRNKNAFTCSKELVGEKSSETQLLSLTTKGVRKKDINNAEGKLPESFDTYQYVKENDIIMCLFDLDCSAVFSGISFYDGMISPAYRVLTCTDRTFPKYAGYWFNYISHDRKFNHYSKNIRYTLSYEEFSALPIVVPPYEEQHRISAYLDAKCEKIDSIIARQQEVIEKLKAYKLSVITEAVTKGLHPDVRMKDSGYEFIGTVPQHWNVCRLRNIGTPQNGISKGGEFFGHGYPFVSYGDVYRNFTLPENINGLIDTTEAERMQYSVKSGDIFFTRTSETIEEVGFSCVCEKPIENATFAGFVIRVRPFTDDLLTSYAKYYFRSNHHRFYLVKEMNLVTRASLGQNLLKSMPVLLPPKSEQQQIADHLDKKCSAIDSAIAKKQAIIEKLTAYKKSLIYEVVTGKREVKGSDKLTDGVYAVFISPDVKSYAESLLFQKIINMAGKNLKGRTHLMKIFHAVEIVIGFDFGTQYIRHTHGPYSDKIKSLEKDLTDKGWLSVKKGKHIEYSVLDSSSYESDYNKYFKNYDSDIRNIVNCFLTMKRTSKAEKFATLLASWNDFIIDGVEPTDEMIINDVRTNWTENKANTDKETWQEILKQIKKANIIPRGYGKHTIRKDN